MDDTVRVEEIRPARERAAEALICLAVIIGLASVVFRHPVTTAAGGVARLAFLWLNRQRLGPVTLVPFALLRFPPPPPPEPDGGVWRSMRLPTTIWSALRRLGLSHKKSR